MRLGCQPDLSELLRLTDAWNEYYADVWSRDRPEYAAELARTPGQARDTVRRLLEDAAESLKALRRQCGEALKAAKAGRR